MAPSEPSGAGQGSVKPIAVVVVGMAGSGKTTFMQRINSYLHSEGRIPYVLNLDPAVRSTPYEANIDIRDSVNYKQVMKTYNLGPNGGILTSLNLFATKIDQVMGILEKRCLPGSPESVVTDLTQTSAKDGAVKKIPEHILLDTPGQIEVFVWSASGAILLSALASSFPTVLAYVIDTPRTTASTSTFMSNMLYAISILYKTRLPMILVFNKTDVKEPDEAIEWMRDFESFQAALRQEEEAEAGGGNGGSGYMSSLLNSMSLVLEEFYNNLSVVAVSSMTGDGVDNFFEALTRKRDEFEREYAPELTRRKAEREQEKEGLRQKEVEKLMKDMGVKDGRKEREEPETVSEAEDMSDVEDSDQDMEDQKVGGVSAGLKDRYDEALKSSEVDPSDASFANYITAASMSRP